MTILEMISEWRKGCSCGPCNPANCQDCTVALIDAIEVQLNKQNEKLTVNNLEHVQYSKECGEVYSLECPKCHIEVTYADAQWWKSECQCGEWVIKMEAVLDEK